MFSKRQNDAILAPIMTASGKASGIRVRTNVSLTKQVLAAIDAARSKRVGSQSRNTWIAEAIHDNLARESAANDQQETKREGNGLFFAFLAGARVARMSLRPNWTRQCPGVMDLSGADLRETGGLAWAFPPWPDGAPD